MLNDPPCLIIIKSYFSLKDQIRMAYEALNKYIYDPHRTNLYIYDEYNPFPKSFVEEVDVEKNLKNLQGLTQQQDANKSKAINEHEFRGETSPYNYRHFITLGESFNFNTKLRWANLGY
jgi:alkylated DNA repair protein alkB family protein 1